MDWLVFACTFPPGRSSPRVAVWRRLQREGAVAPKAGLYLLPVRPACVEALDWIANEARAEGGEPLMIRAAAIEGIEERQLVALFMAARRQDYEALSARIAAAERQVEEEQPQGAGPLLQRLRTELHAIRRIDYFESPESETVERRLDDVARRLVGETLAPSVTRRSPADYQGRTWSTRPSPFVDRLASAWLIRRFIDPAATIRYAPGVRAGEVGFDLPGGEFEHVGNRCTFEVMVEAFGVEHPGLPRIAEIVHEIDLHDGRYARPECAGVEAVLAGLRDSGQSDEQVETAALTLFDALARFAAAEVSSEPAASRLDPATTRD